MKKIGLLLLLFAGICPPALRAQIDALQGYCNNGAKHATTQGSNSTNFQQQVIPSCTVTVYLTGTTTLATIYADNLGTPLANPFTATASTVANSGKWIFWAASGVGYDVVLSGGISPNTYAVPVTLTDLKVGGGGGGSGVTSFSAGNLPPLFTTNVLNPATTPNLLFNLASQQAQTLFGNISGVSGDPFFFITACTGLLTCTYNSGTNTWTLNVPTTSTLSITSTDPIKVNGANGPVSSGTANISCPTCGQVNLQPQIVPPVAGQYAILYPHSVSSSGQVYNVDNHGGTLAVGPLCSLSQNSSITWSGYSLADYGIDPANVTAVYAGSINGLYGTADNTACFFSYAPYVYASNSIVTTGTTSDLNAGTTPPWTMAQKTALTTLTGPDIATATTTDSVTLSSGTALKTWVNVASVFLIVYYTGSPVTTPNYLNVASPLNYDFSSNTIGLDPNYPYYLLASSVATLPNADNAYPQIRAVFDGATATDCTVGGGTYYVVCARYPSTFPHYEWVAMTGGSGSGSVTSVAADTTSGLNSSPNPIVGTGTISCQQGSATQFGCVKADGTTITASGGVLSAVGGGSVGGSGTAGFYALWSASTTLGNGSLDDGITAAGFVSSSKPFQVVCTTCSTQIDLPYNTGHPPTPGSATTASFAPDASGNGTLSEGGTAYSRICTAANAGSVTGCGGGGGGSLPTATAPGQIITSTAAGTTYAVQGNVFYSQSGDTISSIESECSSPCTYIVTGPQTITLSANHAMNSNVHLLFYANGLWTVNGVGFTLSNVKINQSSALTKHINDLTNGGGTAAVRAATTQASASDAWFGAVGDNSTDDTNSLQACINFIAESGVCQLRALTYKITAALTTTSAGTGIVGVPAAPGPLGTFNSTIINQATASANIIDFSFAGFLSGTVIENLSLRRSTPASGTAKGLALAFLSSPTIKNIQAADSVQNFYFFAVGNGDISGLISRSCYNIGYAAGVTSVYGFYWNAGQYSFYSKADVIAATGTACGTPPTVYGGYFNGTVDAYLDSFETAGTDYGVYLNGTDDVRINNLVTDQTKITSIYATGTLKNTFVSAKRIDAPNGASTGIDLESGSGGVFATPNITGSYSTASVYFHNWTGGVMTGGKIDGCGTSGLCIGLNGSSNNVITGNSIGSTSIGLQLINSSYNQVGGNQFPSGQGGPSALITADASSSHNHWLNNNAFFTTTGTLISDSGTDNQQPTTTTVNGQSCTLGGSCTIPPTSGTVTYTTSQTASTSDAGKLVIMNCASACSYTLPATQPSTTWGISIQSVGTATATIALGGSDTYNGGSVAPTLLNYAVNPIWANSATATDYRGGTPLAQGANVTITSSATSQSISASGGGGGGGNYVNIGNAVTPTGCTMSGTAPYVCTVSGTTTSTVTFASIPGTYLNLHFKEIGGSVTGAVSMRITFNGDSTTGHYVEIGNQTSNNSVTGFGIGNLAGAWGGALNTGTSTYTEEVDGYALSTIKNVHSLGSTLNDSFTSSLLGSSSNMSIFDSYWNSTAAITSVSFSVGSDHFANGTVFMIYASN